MTTIRDSAQQHLAEQREYVKKRQLEDQRKAALQSGRSGLVDEAMLAETMRSVRYKDEAHAAGDIIDNGIESGATQIHVVFKCKGVKITEIAFVDDGSGIDQTFLPHATKWGGSSNLGRRNTFGRFGFGLPSVSVNRGREFSVISRINSSEQFQAVTVDLDNLVGKGGIVQLPTPRQEELPGWVLDYVTSLDSKGAPQFAGGLDAVRTVVIWTKFDSLAWPNQQQAASRFKEHLGSTYAGWLEVVKLYVDGGLVEPVDVLFTTPGHRWYKLPGFPNAEPQSSITFDATDTHGAKHPVTVRLSMLPVAAYDATPPPEGRGAPPKIRKRIRGENNGIFVTRNGRFIELANPQLPKFTWNNYARQVGVALDFPPALDELFGVTPDKQTIMLDERVTKLLETHGVVRAMKALYKAVDAERARLKAERDATAGDGPRPSETAIAKVVEKDVKATRKTAEETRDEAEKNLREKVERIAKETGLDEKAIEEAQEKQALERPYRVEFARLTEDDPFYVPYMEGPQVVLRINTEHPWYRDLYSRLEVDQAELRSALELMLWVLATSEIDATGETRVFYRAERAQWSRRLADAFDIHPLVFNKAASRDEAREFDTEPWSEDLDVEAAG